MIICRRTAALLVALVLCLSWTAHADENPTAPPLGPWEQRLAEQRGLSAMPPGEESRKNWAAPAEDDGQAAAQGLLLQAMSLIGVKYRWGGNDPESGLDCSGFVRYVFQSALNIALPHNALAMSRLGANVERDDLRPGDLVFFNTLGRAFSHVGIYLGDDRFIHSPRAGRSVEVQNINLAYWKARWNGGRRVESGSVTGVNVAALLAAAGKPAQPKADAARECRKVSKGKGKRRKTVTVCDNASDHPTATAAKPKKKKKKKR
ncbi:C40 family peptidase [Chitiniphilus purpureus]|uniref:C40 family peptidase n=1 Tax=Chitiniphilus purpureus TaxID=2981137 RepID=A0ABY6DK01_9NEIS|nr:C40 family peptidase [Chitiniphilus sp. CD1]UXY14018.1 C40 family peptidase [Chitiniphilus sp. CD1]